MRILVAGLAGGLTLNVVMALTFRLLGFGWNGGGFLLTSPIQSRKLIAVWTQLEPLPLIVVNPVPMIYGLVLFGVVHAAIYGWLAHAWPAGVFRRAARFAALNFVLTYLFWEFFTPVNMFGEPFALVLVELLFWAFIATTEACVIATVMERRRSRRS
ncbi:hypothetical protein M0D69_02245 [Caballeronia sp. SEWSISQ10-4 2]|uniref:hypothetical protein n=1 Tax=Caballeronia sp. SEWSISQ10-4 2 TaxID=2937438 RepID=UPI002650A19C|nr:hypothetical protein [Caballeronia sp. SEWSISQ10-4 2]MDN7176862.1 hypothetical protein [Caballeronia sp. SEWSISQ10-4 2]